MSSPSGGVLRHLVGRLTIVAATVVLATLLAGCGQHPAPRAAGPSAGWRTSTPAAITVAGRDTPYAGTVPWSNAVTATATSTTVTIYADGDQIGHGVCGLPVERVEVHQDADSVHVLVVGYADPLPTGQACAGVGHSPQPHRVQLSDPLGGRRLIDAADQTTHRVLVAATVPTLTGVPARYRQVPVTWDEQTGEADRTWRTATPTASALPSTITLTRAPAGVIQSHDGPPGPGKPDGPDGTLVATAVPLPTGTARVWDYTYRYGRIITVRWTSADGMDHQLLTATPPAGNLDVAQAEALARAMR